MAPTRGVKSITTDAGWSELSKTGTFGLKFVTVPIRPRRRLSVGVGDAIAGLGPNLSQICLNPATFEPGFRGEAVTRYGSNRLFHEPSLKFFPCAATQHSGTKTPPNSLEIIIPCTPREGGIMPVGG